MKRICLFMVLALIPLRAQEPSTNDIIRAERELVELRRLREEDRMKRLEEFDRMFAEKLRKTASGLQFIEVKEGTGKFPERGQKVQVRYSGWLRDGRLFDTSENKEGGLYEFEVGYERVILGWDEGVSGMKVGGKRRLIIPPKLGYGERGHGRVVPPNATLVFDVELVKIVEGK